MRTTADQIESSEKIKYSRSTGQVFHPFKPRQPSSREIPQPRYFRENERTWETSHAIRVVQLKNKSQPPRCLRSDGNEPHLPLYSHHHSPCPLTPPPPTPPCISSHFTTHLRLRSHWATTTARWASGQKLSLRRGWQRSSTSPPVLSIEATAFTPCPIFRNPNFVSPTDKMVTPVSQKLNAARKKHFDKCVTLF